MMTRDFSFSLYRLNKRSDDSEGQQSLPFPGFKPIETDEDIIAVIQEACHPAYGADDEQPTAKYEWSLTNFCKFKDAEFGEAIAFQITKSTISKLGFTPTDDGKTVEAVTEFIPPQSTMSQAICYMQHHLVAVEDFAEITQTSRWKEKTHLIFDNAANLLGYTTNIRLEIVPVYSEIFKTFFGFDRLTRLSVTLLLPNPEIPEGAQGFYDELVRADIRKYKQDMSNPKGLSQKPGALPHVAAAIAQAGYKDGDLLMEGEIDGEFKQSHTGNNPCSGKLLGQRDPVRSIHENDNDGAVNQLLRGLLKEIYRVKKDEPAETGRS